MSFTGKATYSAGATLPEIAEDVADLVAVNSPHETPLLDALGDPARSARSTVHEWIEDALLPNTDTLETFSVPDNEATVDHADYFRVGDQIIVGDNTEVMLVTAIDTIAGTLTVTRNYGGSGTGSVADGSTIRILGNAALEGDEATPARFTSRQRSTNVTQIFSATVEISGSELAVRQLGVRDELDYQKNQRTRELLRDWRTASSTASCRLPIRRVPARCDERCAG